MLRAIKRETEGQGASGQIIDSITIVVSKPNFRSLWRIFFKPVFHYTIKHTSVNITRDVLKVRKKICSE